LVVGYFLDQEEQKARIRMNCVQGAGVIAQPTLKPWD
jgi:hypothetical protein